MGMRPPLRGYNHNVRHDGRLFHVQTEDAGPPSGVVHTHVFLGGRVIASRRSEYSSDESERCVLALMQGQHKALLLELRAGTFDGQSGEESALNQPAARDNTEPSQVVADDLPPLELDDELLLLEARIDDLTGGASPPEFNPNETLRYSRREPLAAPAHPPPLAAPYSSEATADGLVASRQSRVAGAQGEIDAALVAALQRDLER